MKTMENYKKQIYENLSAYTIANYIHSKIEDWVCDEVYDGNFKLSETEKENLIDECTNHIFSKIKINQI